MMFVYAILGQIRKATENVTIAQTLSIPTLALSIVFNFVYFSWFFDLASKRSVSFQDDNF